MSIRELSRANTVIKAGFGQILMGGSGGAGRGFTPGIPAGPGTTEALSFVTKQCVALTHGFLCLLCGLS